MKKFLMGFSAALGMLFAAGSVFSQTTTSRGTPTISGFSPNPVSGFSSQPVTGFTPAPVGGLTPLPVLPTSSNFTFTTGPISPLSTGIAGTNPTAQPIAPPLPPVSVVRPIRTNSVSNAVGTPLF